MTYSCAYLLRIYTPKNPSICHCFSLCDINVLRSRYFKGIDSASLDSRDLERAQEAKVKLIADKLQLESGMTVLDIGCGWGFAAWYMAENFDVNVVGISLSAEQCDFLRIFY